MVEVLVVVLLFSFGLIGLVGVQARAVQFSVGAEDTGRAAVLANEIASQMWATNTVNLPAGVVSDWADRVGNPTSGGLPNGEGSVVVDGNVARVTVSWRPPHAPVGEERRYITDVLIATP